VTEWYSYHPEINAVLKLNEGETIAGFVYIGTATETQDDRKRPNVDAITSYWYKREK
jgi:hypothetical protein